jgi:hypothetical protein
MKSRSQHPHLVCDTFTEQKRRFIRVNESQERKKERRELNGEAKKGHGMEG